MTPAVLFLGTTEEDLKLWAELLKVDPSYLLSEAALNDRDLLPHRLAGLPRQFSGERSLDSMKQC